MGLEFMNRLRLGASIGALTAVLWPLGCGSPPEGDPQGGSTSTSGGSVGSTDSSGLDASSGIDPTTSTTRSDTSTGIEPEGDTECEPMEAPECDLFAQDCPEGDKCGPTGTNDCGEWSTAHCVPVADDPGQVGEPCTVSGDRLDHSDDCDLGLVCWGGSDPWEGTCLPLCGGSPRSPTCPAWFTCVETSLIVADRVDVCLPTCDPLVVDACPAEYACMPFGGAYQCLPASGAQAPGESCGPRLDCAPGSRCVNEVAVPGCSRGTCCSSHCDLGAPDPAAGCLPGQTCTPPADPSLVPPELAHVGVCRL